MKHFYLNDVSKQNFLNISGFDYALVILNIVFLFIKQIFFIFSCFTLIEGLQ